MQELNSVFKSGEDYYRKHKDYPKGVVTAEFLRGVQFQERLSKCAFRYCNWHKDQKVVSL